MMKTETLLPPPTANVQMSSVTCKTCRLHHSLDENGQCGFCRREPAAGDNGSNVLIFIAALVIVSVIVAGLVEVARLNSGS